MSKHNGDETRTYKRRLRTGEALSFGEWGESTDEKEPAPTWKVSAEITFLRLETDDPRPVFFLEDSKQGRAWPERLRIGETLQVTSDIVLGYLPLPSNVQAVTPRIYVAVTFPAKWQDPRVIERGLAPKPKGEKAS